MHNFINLARHTRIATGVRHAVADRTGIPPENVYFGQTHTHAGPDLQGLWGGVPASWIDALYQRVAELAEQALANGARTGRIAEDLGFSDESAFAKAFKRWTGRTPARFREAPPD